MNPDHFDYFDSRTPTPDTVAAWLSLGIAPSERAPWWAARWLTENYDGPAQRELAGPGGRDT